MQIPRGYAASIVSPFSTAAPLRSSVCGKVAQADAGCSVTAGGKCRHCPPQHASSGYIRTKHPTCEPCSKNAHQTTPHHNTIHTRDPLHILPFHADGCGLMVHAAAKISKPYHGFNLTLMLTHGFSNQPRLPPPSDRLFLLLQPQQNNREGVNGFPVRLGDEWCTAGALSSCRVQPET